MKALTICQPYASAIVHGLKKVENRTWETRYRGLLLIHAGKSRAYLENAIAAYGSHFLWLRPNSLPFGAIIGRVNLVDCVNEEEGKRIDPVWANGPFCFVLENPVLFEPPIPYKGAQGFFDVPESVVKEALS
jgi:hypothetical protein